MVCPFAVGQACSSVPSWAGSAWLLDGTQQFWILCVCAYTFVYICVKASVVEERHFHAMTAAWVLQHLPASPRTKQGLLPLNPLKDCLVDPSPVAHSLLTCGGPWNRMLAHPKKPSLILPRPGSHTGLRGLYQLGKSPGSWDRQVFPLGRVFGLFMGKGEDWRSSPLQVSRGPGTW